MGEKKASRDERLARLEDVYGTLQARLATTALDMLLTTISYRQPRRLLRAAVTEELNRVTQERSASHATATATDFEGTAEEMTELVDDLLEVSSFLEPVADVLAHHTRERLVVVKADPLELKVQVLGHELSAPDVKTLEHDVKDLVVIEQGKHAEVMARAVAAVARSSDTLEELLTVSPDDHSGNSYSLHLHELRGRLRKCAGDLALEDLHEVIHEAQRWDASLRAQITTASKPADRPVRRGVLAGAPAATVAALLAVLGLGTAALAVTVLVPLLVAAAVLAPRWRPAAPVAVAPRDLRATSPSIPEPWTDASARFLANRLTRWQEALAAEPERADAVAVLVERAREVLLSRTPLSLPALVQGDIERFVDEHLPASVDAYVRLTLVDESTRTQAQGEFDDQLRVLTSRLASLTRTSETSALEELRVQGHFLRSFEPSALDLETK